MFFAMFFAMFFRTHILTAVPPTVTPPKIKILLPVYRSESQNENMLFPSNENV